MLHQTDARPTEIADDGDLLDLLTADQRSVDGLFAAGDYWRHNAERIVAELKRSGLRGFRRNTRVGKGFVDILQLDPMDTHHRGSRTYRFHQLVSRLPFVRRHLLQIYENAIRRAWTDAVFFEGELVKLQAASVLEKHAELLSRLDTTAGDTGFVTEIAGRPVALTYLRQLCRLEALAPEMDFPAARRFVEIGGGFGVNAHLQLELNPQIERFVYIDIPPMLYVGTQYLKAHFPGEVYTYADWQRTRPADLDGIDSRLICLPPWVLAESRFTWERGMNAASFQEMEPAQMRFYLETLARNAAPDARLAALYYRSNNASMEETAFAELLAEGMQVSELGQPEPNVDPRLIYRLARPAETSAA